MNNLYSILLKTARQGIRKQDPESGRMPSGHNGPWKHIDTSVRNTSHWLITFFAAYEVSENDIFQDCANRCLEFLTSDTARPQNKTFIHRKDGGNNCNGLIGQAWTLEALIYADEFVKQDLMNLAEEVYLLHPFDSELGLWRSVDVDGSIGSIHSTFNQQLWFAAIGSQLAKKNSEIKKMVSRFLDQLETNIRLTRDGLIVHNSYPHEGYRRFRYDMKNAFLRDVRQQRRELAVGYHSFNLYGMALLYREYPSHPFWKTTVFESTLQYANSDKYLNDAKDNRYCFGYNPTGLEVAFAGNTFDYVDLNVEEWVERQLSLTYDPLDGLMNKGSDPTTLAARFYEAVRLPNIEFGDMSFFVTGQEQ